MDDAHERDDTVHQGTGLFVNAGGKTSLCVSIGGCIPRLHCIGAPWTMF